MGKNSELEKGNGHGLNLALELGLRAVDRLGGHGNVVLRGKRHQPGIRPGSKRAETGRRVSLRIGREVDQVAGAVRSARSYVLNTWNVGGWRLCERIDITGGQSIFGVERVFQAGGQRFQARFRAVESPLPVSVVAAQFLVGHHQPAQPSNHNGHQQEHNKRDGQRHSLFPTIPHVRSPPRGTSQIILSDTH